jgi:hypothetical protein
MGCHVNITATKRPKQGHYLGMRAEVCFHYDTSKRFGAKVIRDDEEEPGTMLLQLDDGFVVDATECQWSPRP